MNIQQYRQAAVSIRQRLGSFRSALIVALLALIGTPFLAAPANPARAAAPGPGELDTTFAEFGRNGIVIPSGLSRINGVFVQPDGKIVVGGDTGSFQELAVFRFLPDGRPDATFGDDGKAIFPNMFRAEDIAVQSDGRIVVGGNRNFDYQLARLTAHGSLDRSFAGDGWAEDSDPELSELKAILVRSDGSIVACGNAYVGDDYDFGVVRYTAEGKRDLAFGGGDGRLTIGFGGQDTCLDIVQQSDGKLVLAGERDDPGTFGDGRAFAVARLEINGTLDNDNGDGGFDGDGKLTTDFGDDADGKAVALQSDGKIVVLGNDADPGASYVARYLPNGRLDGSFDGDGKLKIPTDVLHDLALQPDGKLVALGRHRSPDSETKFALHRLLPDGKADPTFSDRTYAVGLSTA